MKHPWMSSRLYKVPTTWIHFVPPGESEQVPATEHPSVSTGPKALARSAASVAATMLSLALAGWFLHAWLQARQAWAHIPSGSLLRVPGDWPLARVLCLLAVLAAVAVAAFALARRTAGRGVTIPLVVLVATVALGVSIWLTPAQFTTSFHVDDVVRPDRYLAALLLCVPALVCFTTQTVAALRALAKVQP